MSVGRKKATSGRAESPPTLTIHSKSPASVTVAESKKCGEHDMYPCNLNNISAIDSEAQPYTPYNQVRCLLRDAINCYSQLKIFWASYTMLQIKVGQLETLTVLSATKYCLLYLSPGLPFLAFSVPRIHDMSQDLEIYHCPGKHHKEMIAFIKVLVRTYIDSLSRN